MICELNKQEFMNVIPLNKYYNIEIPAILSGNSYGKVFADSKTTPKTALIWTKDGSFFIGDTNNEKFNHDIKRFVDNELTSLCKKYDINCHAILCVSNEWENKLKSLFANRDLSISNQLVYRMNINNFDLINSKKSNEYSIEKIDKNLIQLNLVNSEKIIEDIEEFWDDINDFYKKGLGFAVVKDNKIVSRCSISFMYNDINTIGIWTDKAYRKQGYAKKAVLQMLKHIKESKLDPYWDCMEENTASRSLAESVGFKIDFKYKLIKFVLDK